MMTQTVKSSNVNRATCSACNVTVTRATQQGIALAIDSHNATTHALEAKLEAFATFVRAMRALPLTRSAQQVAVCVRISRTSQA